MHRTKKKSESLIGTCGQVCQKGDFDTCFPHTPKLFWMRVHERNPDFHLGYFLVVLEYIVTRFSAFRNCL